jgi:hypothetical protein
MTHDIRKTRCVELELAAQNLASSNYEFLDKKSAGKQARLPSYCGRRYSLLSREAYLSLGYNCCESSEGSAELSCLLRTLSTSIQ